MDAIALLKEDHDKVKRLLTELESTTERGVKTRSELFATIKGELTVHEIIEEEIFYPELKAHPKARDIVLEGYEEHHVVDLLMGELESLDVSDETWGAKAIVMKENIEHHIDEEEGEMFAKARQVFDRAELVGPGRAYGRAKAVGPAGAEHPRHHSLTTAVHIGTSGFLYEHWRGRFYPPAARGAELEYFADAVRHGRAECHVLPDAGKRDVPQLGGAGPGWLHLRGQGEPVPDPRPPAARAEGARGVPDGARR